MLESVRFLSGLYKVNTQLVGNVFKGLTQSQISTRPSQESNSMHWILGHLVNSRYGAAQLLGSKLEHPFGEKFSRGSSDSDPGSYPDLETLLSHWERISTELDDRFASISQDDLDNPVDRSFPGVENTVLGGVSFLHLHESYHVGQLAYIRRILGESQLVG
jgi:hypothetical protein